MSRNRNKRKVKKFSLILTQFPFESEIGERDIFVVLVFGFVKTKKKQSVTVAKCKNSFYFINIKRTELKCER
jgi:hypothetical protein